MEEESTLPPPYNLVPSCKSICKLFRWCMARDDQKDYSCSIWVRLCLHQAKVMSRLFSLEWVTHILMAVFTPSKAKRQSKQFTFSFAWCERTLRRHDISWKLFALLEWLLIRYYTSMMSIYLFLLLFHFRDAVT